MISFLYQTDHARALWRSCIASAFRTALACSIVGCTTLFGPSSFRRQVAYPAFSYVTVILVITDATLGDTLRGCWDSLQASFLAVCPAFLSLWLIGPARLTHSSTALAVSLTAFVVVLPENTRLVSKRIALGQTVLVYVLAFINGPRAHPIMHPVHLLASTAVGVMACVLAMLLPYPSLACYEVNKNWKLFTKNGSERLKLFVKAFSAEDNNSALGLILQAKSLVTTGTKLLRIIKSKQESMQWERLSFRFWLPHCNNPGEKLQDLETPLRGMEVALCNSTSFPLGILSSELERDLASIERRIASQVETIPLASATFPESNAESVGKSLRTIQSIPLELKNLPSLFFLFCLQLLQRNSVPTVGCGKEEESSSSPAAAAGSQKNEGRFFGRISRNLALPININRKRLIPAFKCSASLGLAVLFGSIYSRENGYWAGLPVGISLASSREATFKVANIKAQGTVLGTVYGVLGCFVFERYVQIRFISLVPWFIFCSFLRCSRMYGQAGGISAVIGAVLILGRKNFGPTSEFAIERIVETFIGLSCSIMVEILLQPTRASTLSKIQLSRSFELLRDSLNSITLFPSECNKLKKSLKSLKLQLIELGKTIAEAEAEPNFWFLPFHGACYRKLLGSLSKMEEFLLFMTHAIQFLQQESARINNSSSSLWKDTVNNLELDLKIPKDKIFSSMKCLEEVNMVKSVTILNNKFEEKKISLDPELGKSTMVMSVKSPGADEEDEDEIEKNMKSFLQHSKGLIDAIIEENEGEEEIKSQLVLSLSSMAYCMNSLVTETREIEKGIKELVQWENPSRHVNVHEISCKIRALADTHNSK